MKVHVDYARWNAEIIPHTSFNEWINRETNCLFPMLKMCSNNGQPVHSVGPLLYFQFAAWHIRYQICNTMSMVMRSPSAKCTHIDLQMVLLLLAFCRHRRRYCCCRRRRCCCRRRRRFFYCVLALSVWLTVCLAVLLFFVVVCCFASFTSTFRSPHWLSTFSANAYNSYPLCTQIETHVSHSFASQYSLQFFFLQFYIIPRILFTYSFIFVEYFIIITTFLYIRCFFISSCCCCCFLHLWLLYTVHNRQCS